MMRSIEEIMTEAILQSREFCGDEREAAIEAALEMTGRRPFREELGAAFAQAESRWNAWRREARRAAECPP